jgi:hypothetical protein
MPLGIMVERDFARESAKSLRQIAEDLDRLARGAVEGRGVHPEMRAIARHLDRIAETLNKSVDSGSVNKTQINSMATQFEGVARALRGGGTQSK